MQNRWLKYLEDSIPQLDLVDVFAVLANPQDGR